MPDQCREDQPIYFALRNGRDVKCGDVLDDGSAKLAQAELEIVQAKKELLAHRERQRKYYYANLEKKQQASRDYYARHKAKVLERARAKYQGESRAVRRARSKASYYRNREKILARMHKQYHENHEMTLKVLRIKRGIKKPRIKFNAA